MSAHDEDRDLYEDPGLYWNPAPKPTPPVTYGEPYTVTVTPAVDRAARKFPSSATPRSDAFVALNAGLSAEELTKALSEVLAERVIWSSDQAREDVARALAASVRTTVLGRP